MMSLEVAEVFAVLAFVEATVALIVLLAWKFSTHKVEYVTDTQHNVIRKTLGINGKGAPAPASDDDDIKRKMNDLFSAASGLDPLEFVDGD